MADNLNSKVHTDVEVNISPLPLQKWGGIASFLLVVANLVAQYIYLTGNLRDPLGPFVYALADFLYGPLCAALLVTVLLALRERVSGRAERRMSLALVTTILAAAMMVLVSCVRASSRHYQVLHPNIVQGMIAAGWHFLGWALLLVTSAGWTTRSLPRPLSILSLVAGFLSLFVYLFPNLEPFAAPLVVIWAVWLGILLWRGKPREQAKESKIM